MSLRVERNQQVIGNRNSEGLFASNSGENKSPEPSKLARISPSLARIALTGLLGVSLALGTIRMLEENNDHLVCAQGPDDNILSPVPDTQDRIPERCLAPETPNSPLHYNEVVLARVADNKPNMIGVVIGGPFPPYSPDTILNCEYVIAGRGLTNRAHVVENGILGGELLTYAEGTQVNVLDSDDQPVFQAVLTGEGRYLEINDKYEAQAKVRWTAPEDGKDILHEGWVGINSVRPVENTVNTNTKWVKVIWPKTPGYFTSKPIIEETAKN